jgi:hypothetical protein
MLCPLLQALVDDWYPGHPAAVMYSVSIHLLGAWLVMCQLTAM